MRNVKLEIPLGELDVVREIPFDVTYNIDDVRKPESKNANYSKTIALAGTANNNRLLGGLFDINSDFSIFNPNIKTSARIIVDGTRVMEGSMQLKSIDKATDNYNDGSSITYKVLIRADESTFFSDIKDKLLKDVDTTEGNHTYNKKDIQDSWDISNNKVYAYPLLYKHNNTNSEYRTTTAVGDATGDFRPCVYHKYFAKQIAGEAGYSLGGSLFDESTPEGAAYAREIVPLLGQPPTKTYNDRKVYASATNDEPITGGYISVPAAYQNNGRLLTLIDDDSTGINYDNSGGYNVLDHEWISRDNGTYKIQAGVNVTTVSTTKHAITSVSDYSSTVPNCVLITTATPHGMSSFNVTGYSLSLVGMSVSSYDGNYGSPVTIKAINATQFYVNHSFDGNSVGFAGVDCNLYYRNNAPFSNNNIINPDTGTNYNSFGSSIENSFKAKVSIQKNYSGVANTSTKSISKVTQFNAANDWTVTSNVTLTPTLHQELAIVDDSYRLFLSTSENNNTYTQVYYPRSLNDSTEVTPIVSIQANANAGTYFIINPLTASLEDGNDVIISELISEKYKQSDIFTDIIKRYNPYISIDPDNSTKLIIDTRDSYYAKGTSVDWTDKKDYGSKDTITFLSDLQSKEMLFTYKKDDDEPNRKYTEGTGGQIYGEKTISFDNEFVKGTKKVETPFSPTPLSYNDVISTGFAIVSQMDKNYDRNLRVLYFGGMKPTINNAVWKFKYIDEVSGSVETDDFTTYPYAGHLDDPYAPTIDINFGEVAEVVIKPEQTQLTNGNLYNRFWANYIEQIAEGKLVTTKFALNEVDINFIKHNLNTKVFVKDSHYYINKIKSYKPGLDELTTVELLKIKDGVSFVQEDTQILDPSNSLEGMLSSNIIFGSSSDVTGERNTVREGSSGSVVKGSDNYIGVNSSNATIIGANNRIEDGVQNAFIISSNNKTISQDGEGWIGDIYFSNNKIESLDGITITSLELDELVSAKELIPEATYKIDAYTFKAASTTELYPEGFVERRIVDWGVTNYENKDNITPTTGDKAIATADGTYKDNILYEYDGAAWVEIPNTDDTLYKTIINKVTIIKPFNAGYHLASETDAHNNHCIFDFGNYTVSATSFFFDNAIFQCFDFFNVRNNSGVINIPTLQFFMSGNSFSSTTLLIKDNTNCGIVGNFDCNITDNIDRTINNRSNTRVRAQRTVELEIGDWDMADNISGSSTSVSHGLSATEWKTIRQVEATIRQDNDTYYYDLKGESRGVTSYNSTVITIARADGSPFDGNDFNATGFNRGWITFSYTPD